MVKSKKNIILGAISVSVAAILWGLDGIVLTPRLYNLDVSLVVFILHLLPFVLMSLLLFKEFRFVKIFTVSDYTYILLISLFGGAIGTLAIVKALFLMDFQHLTIVVLLQKLQPIFAIMLATIILKERLRRNFLAWASLAIVSGYFLTFGWYLPNLKTGDNTVYAAAYALLATMSFGSSTVFSKKVLEKYEFKTVTFYRYGFTSFIMLLVVMIGGKMDFSTITTENIYIFLIIAFTTGSGAILLYYYGLKKIKAIIATICELFFPLSAIIFDYIFNKTILSPVQWISAIVMLFAIINLNIDNRKAVVTSTKK